MASKNNAFATALSFQSPLLLPVNTSQNKKIEEGVSSTAVDAERAELDPTLASDLERKRSEATSAVTDATSKTRLTKHTDEIQADDIPDDNQDDDVYRSVGADNDEDKDDEDDDFSEDLNEENAFGYQYHAYLSGSPLINNILIFWHMLMMGVSAVALAAGIAIRYYFSWMVITQVKKLPMYATYKKYVQEVDEMKTKITLSSYIDDIGQMLIVFHGLYLFTVFVYMTYPIHKIQFALPIGALITGLVAFVEVIVINVVFAPTLISRQDIVEDLLKKLKEVYVVKGKDPFTISYDYISIWIECCGIIDQYDFQDVDLQMNTLTSVIKLEVPPACCHRKFFAAASTISVDKCAADGEDINQDKGCFSAIVETIKEGCWYYAFLVWTHLADCCIHSSLYKQRVSFLTRVLDYKSDRQDQYMKYLMKRRLQHEELEMQQLFGNRKRPPGAHELIH